MNDLHLSLNDNRIWQYERYGWDDYSLQDKSLYASMVDKINTQTDLFFDGSAIAHCYWRVNPSNRLLAYVYWSDQFPNVRGIRLFSYDTDQDYQDAIQTMQDKLYL